MEEKPVANECISKELSQIVHSDKIAGGFEGSKSWVVLLSESAGADSTFVGARFHLQPEAFHVMPENSEETQILHQQGFVAPATR